MGYSLMSIYVLGGRILLAGIICGILGLEREIKNKGAGMRTHVLVGLAAALIMITSQYGYDSVIREGVTLDPARTAAQVVSGIGFLGAGMIFVRKDIVRGLTTAAGIWLSAAIGLAAGAGLILLTVFTGFLALIAIHVLDLVDIHSSKLNIRITLICLHEPGVVAQVSATIADRGFKIENLVLNRRSLAPDSFEMELLLSGGGDTQELFSYLIELDCVQEIPEFEAQGFTRHSTKYQDNN